MNQKLVDTVVNALLYEGYILYPYRASAKKNRQRFTFGRVYPEPYSVAENGAEPCSMQTQCLIEGLATAKLEVMVRFLHPMARDIGALAAPLREMPALDNPDFFHVVPELQIEGANYFSWQEAVERPVPMPMLLLSELCTEPKSIPFSFSAFRTVEPILDRRKHIAGVIVRRQEAVEGVVELAGERVDDRAFRVTIRIVNKTPVPWEDLDDTNEIVMRTFASTHTILHTPDAQFISLIDPPAVYVEAAAACRNIGAWPILVGEEEKKERDTMLSSPIILYDYPKIAPESPGELFDAGEIDEILTRRIMTMTDEEKREMRGVMHRTGEAFFNPTAKVESVSINGILLKQGDMVRVRPKKRADAMAMALAGRIAMIESIEQDAADKMRLALVLEHDLERDLNFLRQPGHRVLYDTDEVEPLEGE